MAAGGVNNWNRNKFTKNSHVQMRGQWYGAGAIMCVGNHGIAYTNTTDQNGIAVVKRHTNRGGAAQTDRKQPRSETADE